MIQLCPMQTDLKSKGMERVKCSLTKSKLLHLNSVVQKFSKLTGNPTAMLRSAILFIPARRLAGPEKVNLLFSLVPNADPVISV